MTVKLLRWKLPTILPTRDQAIVRERHPRRAIPGAYGAPGGRLLEAPYARIHGIAKTIRIAKTAHGCTGGELCPLARDV